MYTKTTIIETNDTAIKQYFYSKKVYFIKSIFKRVYFILQNMFRSLHTSYSVIQIKSTANIQIKRDLPECYSIVRNTFKNFYLTIFMAINTNIMNKAIKNFTLTIKNTVNI